MSDAQDELSIVRRLLQASQAEADRLRTPEAAGAIFLDSEAGRALMASRAAPRFAHGAKVRYRVRHLGDEVIMRDGVVADVGPTFSYAIRRPDSSTETVLVMECDVVPDNG